MVSAHGIMISSTMRQAYDITAVRMKETAVILCVSLEFRTDVEVFMALQPWDASSSCAPLWHELLVQSGQRLSEKSVYEKTRTQYK